MQWAGASIWLPAGKYIRRSAESLCQPSLGEQSEEVLDFDEAMRRQGITEADLQLKRQRLLVECCFYLVLAMLVFFYGCYMLTHRHWYVFLASGAITVMLFTFAFRAHFWLFQIKTRTLGRSYQDWLSYVLRGEWQ